MFHSFSILRNHFASRNAFRFSSTNGLFAAICPSVGHAFICGQSAQVSSPFPRTQLCTGQSLSQKGVFAPSMRQPVQFIISGVIVTPLSFVHRAAVFFTQSVVVCNRCDSGVAGITVHSAATDQLICVFHNYLHKFEVIYVFHPH